MITKTFCLKDITKGGKLCKDAKVEWVVPNSDCLTSPCDSCNDECIEVSVLDDCDINCIKAVVTCPDCDNCPAEIFDVCFCSKDGDCDVCEKCEKGVCVDKCDGPCDEGICGECDDETPCPGDKVCVNGDCVCPPDKIEQGDRCLDCNDNSPPRNCEVCVDGKWVAKDCGDGVCDPDTGECVGCFNAGDCGPNEVCVDNTCECAPGYVYKPGVGCVPQPPCTTDGDCPDCFVCDGTDCIPRECPEGYICYEGDCVALCNCDEPSCSGKGNSCEEIYSGVCACIPCDGPCPEVPCDDGCECDSEYPCGGNCTTPEDCPDGYGCKGGRCVPCASFDCDECDSIDGCGCNDQGVCVDNKKECTDTFEITKDDDDCRVKARLITQNKCSCERITISSEVKEVSSEGINFLVALRKGDADVESLLSLPKLGDTGIANEVPLAGSVQVKVIEYGTSTSIPNGNVVYTGSHSVTGTDEFETGYLNFNAPGTTIINNVSGATEKVSRVEVIFEIDRKSIQFENGCSYSEEKEVIAYKITTNGRNGFDKYSDITSGSGTNRKYKVLLSETDRAPIFTWFKQPVGGSRAVARKGYATRISNGVYEDGWLDHNDGIEIGHFYSVESDCSCDKTAYYKCPQTGAISTLTYCNPENLVNRLVYTLKECNKKISFKGSSNTFNVCPSNSLGNQVFQLKLNGNVVGEFTAENGKVIIDGDFTLETSIKEIMIELKGNNCPNCYEPITIEDAVLEIDSIGYDCDNQSLTYSLSGGSGNYSVFVDGSPVQIVGGISLDKGEYEITFKDNVTGCEESGTVKVDCCGDLYVTPYNVLYCDGIDPTVRFDIVGGVPTYRYYIEKDGVEITTDVTNDIGNAYKFTAPEEGTYLVRVMDDIGCEATADFDVSITESPSIGFGDLTYCQGATSKAVSFELAGGSAYSYVIKNAGVVVASGDVVGNFSKDLTIASSKTYTIDIENELGCKASSQFTLVSKNCPDPEVEVSTEPVCEDTPLVVTSLITGGAPPYSWTLEEGGSVIASGTGNIVGHDTGTTYTGTPGSVSFKVTATDSNGKTGSDTGVIQITDGTDPNCIQCEEAPEVNIGALVGGNKVDVGQNVTLVPSNQSMLSYAWMEGSNVLGTNLQFSPSTNNEGVHIYRLRYEYSAGCFEFTPEFKLTISDGTCDCDAAIQVTGGIPGMSGQTVTTLNNSGTVCANEGSIDLQASLSANCDEGDPNNPLTIEWTLMRYAGGNNVETIQTTGQYFNYSPTEKGVLSIHMSVQDGTCYSSGETLNVTVDECYSPEPFSITLFDSEDVCEAEADNVKVNFNVLAGATDGGYDTFPFTWKIVKVGSSHTFKSGAVSGGWSAVGSQEFVEHIDLTPFLGQPSVEFKVEVKRTDTSVIKSDTDVVNILPQTDLICTNCPQRNLSVSIQESQNGVIDIFKGDTATLTAVSNSSLGTPTIANYAWKKSGQPTGSNNKVLSVSPTETTKYSLVVTDDKGCTASTSVTVKVTTPCQPVNQSLSWDVSEACTGDPIVLSWSLGNHVSPMQLSINGQILSAYGQTSSGTHNATMGSSDMIAKLISYFDSGCDPTETTAVVNLKSAQDCSPNCSLPDSLGVNVDAPFISYGKMVCPGGDVDVTPVPNGDDTGYTYTWYDAEVGGSSLGTSNPGDAFTITQPTSLTPTNPGSFETIEYSGYRLEATKAGCPTRETTFKLHYSYFGAINGINIDSSGDAMVPFCIVGMLPNCFSESDIASIDSYVIEVDSYTSSDLSSSVTTSGACLGGTCSSDNSCVRLIPPMVSIPNYSGGYNSATVTVQITLNSGYVINATFTQTPQ